MANKKATDVLAYLDDVNAKLPVLPANIRGVLVTVAPWISLIFGILGAVTGLVAFGVLTFLSPLAVVSGGAHAAGLGIVYALLLLVSSVLMLVAFPGLKAHKFSGWNFLFWSEVVSLVSAVVSISISGVLFALIALYLLFQIKSYYK